jgi:hypothetical protein
MRLAYTFGPVYSSIRKNNTHQSVTDRPGNQAAYLLKAAPD